jgi:hypothetical protein
MYLCHGTRLPPEYHVTLEPRFRKDCRINLGGFRRHWCRYRRQDGEVLRRSLVPSLCLNVIWPLYDGDGTGTVVWPLDDGDAGTKNQKGCH